MHAVDPRINAAVVEHGQTVVGLHGLFHFRQTESLAKLLRTAGLFSGWAMKAMESTMPRKMFSTISGDELMKLRFVRTPVLWKGMGSCARSARLVKPRL